MDNKNKDQILEIQHALKAPKNQKNSFGGYMYRNCEDILQALKPHLAEHNLRQTISDKLVNIGERYYIEATVTVKLAGEVIEQSVGFARETKERKGMDSSQITGTASSYARKYALNGLWLIDDTKDADSDSHKKKEKTKVSPERFEKLKEAIANGEYTTEKANAQLDLTAKQALEIKEMEANNGNA